MIDLARYLVGEVESVSGGTTDVQGGPRRRRRLRGGRRVRERRDRDGGGVTLLPGSQERVHVGDQRLQGLDCVRPRAPERAAGATSRGSKPGERAQGFRDVLVSEADHPFWEHWWPHGHIIGWEHSFVHEIHHLLTAIAEDGDVAPHGATFEDGYRAAEVCDAIVAVERVGPAGRGRVSLSVAFNSSPPAWATSSSPRSSPTQSCCSRRRATRSTFRREQVCCGQPAFNAGHRAAARRVARTFVARLLAGPCPSSARPAPARRWSAHYLPELLGVEPLRGLGALRLPRPGEADAPPLATTGARSPTTTPATCCASSGSPTSPGACWKRSGAQLVALPRPDLCCGFGGTFSVRQPEISVAMADEKLARRCATPTLS